MSSSRLFARFDHDRSPIVVATGSQVVHEAPVRVLMLGMNTASQMSITVRALRRIGVEADGIVWDASVIVSDDGLRNLAQRVSPRERLRRGVLRTSGSYSIASAIYRADVVHWNYGLPVWGPGLDLKMFRALRRTGVVEFWGSDVRIRAIAERDNPYYARRGADYENELGETLEASYARQELFARHGVRTCLAQPWFDRYLEPGLFTQVHSFARLFPEDFTVQPPQRSGRPVVVHAPSKRGLKGTEAVLRAVERLRTQFDFDFVLLHGLPRGDVLRAMQQCDVYLDQFLIGEYGMASLEAMAFGRPAVCYLRQDVVERSPGKLPIVNASQDALCDRLAELLANPARREEIGIESRRYVEQYHDATRHARSLAIVYEQLIGGGK
jgi:glycosyltransferase involved in cell wall biosynthesis